MNLEIFITFTGKPGQRSITCNGHTLEEVQLPPEDRGTCRTCDACKFGLCHIIVNLRHVHARLAGLEPDSYPPYPGEDMCRSESVWHENKSLAGTTAT
jgi:hypothetical protein